MPISYWIIFHILVVSAIVLDLYLFHGKKKEPSFKEASLSSLAWISLAFLFNGWIYYIKGSEAAIAFLTGYLVEESLSIDNLFIFLIIFSQFKVPPSAKKIILLYGVLGAIVMRATLIIGGLALVEMFHWMFYLFGAFLIYTGIHLALQKEKEIPLEENRIYKFFSSIIPFTNTYEGNSFFIKQDGKWIATPLLMVLILIETTDLIFALDSVPAIFGITLDPFIVYTSNIFAILGLRSLFFVVEKFLKLFHLLHYALALILVLIGLKMIADHWFKIPVIAMLLTTVSILGIAMIASLLFPKHESPDTSPNDNKPKLP